MKLISNLDVNGNKFINGDLTLQMPTELTGAQTIATLTDLEQFGGAFQFKGTAKSISADMITITLNDDTTVSAVGHAGNVYQISDKEYASNGTVWVELGFNIDLTPYLTKSEAASTYETIANVSTLAGRVTTAEGKITTAENDIDSLETRMGTAEGDIDSLEGRMDTAEGDIDALETSVTTLQGDLEEAEEVTSAALNDLNSRANGHDSDISGLQSSVNGLDGRLSTAETKLTGVEAGAQVNVIEEVQVDGTTLTVTDKAVNIDLSGKVDKVQGKQLSTEDYTTAEKTKLAGIAEGAEVNVQADWAETNTASDAYIANKPTNLAVAYLHTITSAQANNTVTIAKTDHGCGNYPLVQVFAGNEVVSANVTVDTAGGNVTVSWVGIDPATTAIRIRIVGCPTEA